MIKLFFKLLLFLLLSHSSISSNSCTSVSNYSKNYPSSDFEIIKLEIAHIPKDNRATKFMTSYIAISKSTSEKSWFKVLTNTFDLAKEI